MGEQEEVIKWRCNILYNSDNDSTVSNQFPYSELLDIFNKVMV